MMKKLPLCRFLTFCFGALFYGIIEVLFRGITHPTMLIAGGICFVALSAISSIKQLPLLYKCIIGSIFITGIEFIFGCIFNLWLNMAVWDYSRLPFNLAGQVCLIFSVLWGFLCIIGLPISEVMHSAFKKSLKTSKI